jgi:hypothetical protein
LKELRVVKYEPTPFSKRNDSQNSSMPTFFSFPAEEVLQ